MLRGRDEELDRIRHLVAGAQEGRSGVLVIRADPGMGKTALLDHAAAAAGSTGVLRASGIELESGLPFATLHQLLKPLLDDLSALPGPQADALRNALGMAARTTEQDRFLIGLATLTLLAEHGPLLCLVDDAHWVDPASVHALLFAARRLDADGVVLIFATRATSHDAFTSADLPELRLAGLGRESALRVLDEHTPGLPARLRERIVAESGGNPLALLELPAMGPDALATGPLPLPHRLQEAYQQRVAALPPDTRTLLVALSVEDLPTALRATNLPVDVLAPAEREGLVTVAATGVQFRHPLVRAAAYQGASFAERAVVHQALAQAAGADQRAWHLAAAATGPDEQVAAALEQAAHRARGRSGHAEAATALARAAQLTPSTPDRVRRLADAATLAADAGQAGQARELIDQANQHGARSAETARLRARIEFEHGSPEIAWQLLLDTTPGGRDLRVEAARVAWSVGDVARLRTVREHLADDDGLAALIDGAVELLAGDPGTGLDLIRQHLAEAPERHLGADDLPIGTASLALLSGDLRTARAELLRLADELRSGGAIGLLPGVLVAQAEAETLLGLLRQATTTAAEAARIAGDTGQHRHSSHITGVSAFLAALRGVEQAGEGDWASRGRAMLDLGQGRHEAALDRFEALARSPFGVYFVPDQVEAAVRSGQADRAPMARLDSWAEASGQPWTRAVRQRCLALLSGEPEEHFSSAVACADLPVQQARSKLLYGEWLRRSRRKNEARAQLRVALELFQETGATPWADRARAELRAAGESTQPRGEDRLGALSPQELQIVRLVATGATNKEIGAQLFLSPKTVGHHLYRAFPKLGVANRTELAHLDLFTSID